MTAPHDPDAIIAAWLDEGPDVLPESTKRAIAVTYRTIVQSRRPRWLPWRFPIVNGMTRPVFAFVTIAAVAVGGLYFLNRGPGAPSNAGGDPTPTAVPQGTDSPTQIPAGSPIDTSTWIGYHSDRYGFAISHPVGWTEHPADHDWTVEGDADQWLSTGHDAFIGSDVRVSAWSVAVEPGTSAEEWIEAYCPLVSEPCTGIQERGIPVFIEQRDQHPGVLVPFADDTQAFILSGDRMHVVAVWWGESEAAVRPFGGSRRLLEAFLSTMVLGAPEATTAPS